MLLNEIYRKYEYGEYFYYTVVVKSSPVLKAMYNIARYKLSWSLANYQESCFMIVLKSDSLIVAERGWSWHGNSSEVFSSNLYCKRLFKTSSYVVIQYSV